MNFLFPTGGGEIYPISVTSQMHSLLSAMMTNLKSVTILGALLIRNVLEKNRDDSGYSWLPYEYVLSELAVDTELLSLKTGSSLDSKLLCRAEKNTLN